MALTGEPSSRAELLEVLRASEQRELLDAEALSIIEGALTVSDLKSPRDHGAEIAGGFF